MLNYFANIVYFALIYFFFLLFLQNILAFFKERYSKYIHLNTDKGVVYREKVLGQ